MIKNFVRLINKKGLNLSIYLLSSLLPMIVNVLFNPLFAINMSPTDYAICSYYNSFNPIFLPFINFLLVRYYLKKYFEVDSIERKKIKATIFKLSLCFSFVLLIISIVLELIYMYYFNNASEMPILPYSILALLPCYFQTIYILELYDMKMSAKSVKYLKINWMSAFSAILLSLIFVVIFKWGAFGKLFGLVLSSFFIYIYIIYVNKNLFRIQLDIKSIKIIVSFCLPIVIADMLEFFTKGFDRIFLERCITNIELGYYAVGFSIAGLLNIFSKAVSDTFAPDIYEAVAKRDKIKCIKYSIIQMILIILVVVFFILLLPFIINVLTAGRYIKSTDFAIIISLSSISSSLYFIINNILIALGKTKIVLSTKLLGTGFCILMYYYFIKNWGAFGAAWGIVFSYIVLIIASFICYFLSISLKKRMIL